MANRLLRLTVYDPVVVKALDALRKSRKQSAFIVEALKYFLGMPQGQEQLASYLAAIKDPSQSTIKRKNVEKEPATQEKSKVNLDDIFS